MRQKLAFVLAMMLMVSLVCVPVSYAAWADTQSISDDFESYTVEEGAFVPLKTATSNKWTLMSEKYATGYLTKQNGNNVAVFKDFKASAIVDFYLTKTAAENSVTKHIYDFADGGKDQLQRDMMMRFQYYGVATDVAMKKGQAYTLDYDFKYTSGDADLTNISERAGFIFPKNLVPSYSGAGFASYPGVTSLTKAGGQQIYGGGRSVASKENGWYNGGGTLTFNTIWEKNESFVYSDPLTHVDLSETGLAYLGFEFKGLANFNSTGGVDSVFTMLTQSMADYMAEFRANPTSTELPGLKTAAVADLTQKMATADFKIYLDNIALREEFSDRLSLEENTVYYNNTVRTASPILLKAYKPDGTSYSLTGDANVTYQSSDPTVFRFTSGNLLESTGKPGKSIITATYKGKSTSVVMIHFAPTTGGNKMEANMPTAYKTLAGGLLGHNDAQSYSPDPNGAEYANTNEIWALRHYSGRAENWFGKGYRSLSGWFYDDLVNPVGFYIGVIDSEGYTPTGGYLSCHPNFVADYSYGAFDWTGKVSYSAGKQIEANSPTATFYICDSTNVAPRTKGWHQVTVSVEKDPSATWGWSANYYLDGSLFKQMPIVPDATQREPYLELRAKAYFTPKQPNDKYLIYPAHYDDMVMGGSLGASSNVTFDLGANGSVKINDVAKNDGDVVNIGKYDQVVINATPAEGYEIDTFTLGSTPLTADANGSVTLSSVDADATLSVTFKSTAVAQDPDVSSDTSYNYFSNVGGTPTAYVYGKLNNFSGTSTDGYGMNVWVAGAPDQTIQLPAMVGKDQPAVATPNAVFVIKVFGDAIQSDQSYVFQPYVGETTGDEIPVEFEVE